MFFRLFKRRSLAEEEQRRFLEQQHQEQKNVCTDEPPHTPSVQKELPPREEINRRVYVQLLKRYTEYIANMESKTVSEVKALINPTDLSLQSFLLGLLGNLENYNPDTDFDTAARKVFEYVRDNISLFENTIGIHFWLYPKDVLECKAGDDEDQAVFLCSALRALGDDTAYVCMCELSDSTTHAFVCTNFKGVFRILDPTQNLDYDSYVGTEGDLLQRFTYKGHSISKVLYKFSDLFYEEV